MDFKRIAEHCNAILQRLNTILEGRFLFREIFTREYATGDVRDIKDALDNLNFLMHDEVDEVVRRGNLDMLPPEKVDKGFMLYIIRLESAVYNLDRLARTTEKGAALHFLPNSLREAEVWALTGYFRCHEGCFLARCARAYAAGKPTALDKLPSDPPDWGDSVKRR